MTVRFIDENKDELGVEPICRTLQVAPSTYYAAKSRPPSARSLHDAVVLALLVALWTANYSVYGAHKLWKAAQRAGYDVGRDQVPGSCAKAASGACAGGAGWSRPSPTRRLDVPPTW